MSNQRKLMVLLGLLALWGGLIVWQSEEGVLPLMVENAHIEAGGSPIGETAGSQTDGLFEKLMPMEQPKGQITLASPRNIFAPLAWHSPRPKPVKEAKTAKPQTPSRPPAPPPQQTNAPRGPSASELAAQRARQQLRQYRFLGYLTKGGESQAFLTNGQAIYIVKQGELMDGRIHVRKIEPTTVVLSMTVSETGDQVEASIPLVDDRSS